MHCLFAGKIDIARVPSLMKLQCRLRGCRRSFFHLNSEISELEITLMFVERGADFGDDFQDFISNTRLCCFQLRFRSALTQR